MDRAIKRFLDDLSKVQARYAEASTAHDRMEMRSELQRIRMTLATEVEESEKLLQSQLPRKSHGSRK